MKKIFIDGKEGTTGLRIYDRLAGRDDVSVITLSDEERKSISSRKKALNSVDIAFLCLPDDAAREAVSLIDNPDVILIDTSTAHRTESGWAYGFPELSKEFSNNIIHSKRIAVPGCHASGFIALVYPLLESKIISPDALLCCHSLTGYSGGGKKMIAGYEAQDRDALLDAPRQYGLNQNHKHLKEMKAITGISHAPVFCPIVADYYSGMEVTLPLFAENLLPSKGIDDIKNAYKSKYTGDIVKYVENASENGFLSAMSYAGKDSMEITVQGNDERILLVARYDNLGKGASGAAVECLNIKLNADKTKGLDL